MSSQRSDDEETLVNEPVDDKFFNVKGGKNSKKRIFCISVGEFDGLPDLKNHHTDRATMFKTFSRLGYRPTQTTEDRITLNKGKDYMRRFVKKIDKKQSEDNEDLRAVIIYIKTHGSQGNMKDDNYEGIFIHFSDGKIFLWSYLEELLKNEKFKDIPKLIFLEACRGQMHEFAPPEDAMMADARIHSNSIYPPPENTYPLRRNVALFAASTEGNVALLPLDPEKASYFTDAVCTALRDHPYQDLQELKRRVVADLSNTRPLVEASPGEWRNVHLCPVLEDSFTREFKFLQ